MSTLSIALGSDEAGFALKQELADFLHGLGHAVRDYGCHSTAAVDYPDVAETVALAVAAGHHPRAILVCGTGIGMAIAANKVPGIRAAQAHDTYSAERARLSNNAQIVTLGARVVGPELAKSIVRTWLGAEFAGESSASFHKVRKLIEIDHRYRDARQSVAAVPPSLQTANAKER